MNQSSDRPRSFPQYSVKKWAAIFLPVLALTFMLAGAIFTLPRPQAAHAASGDWPSYLANNRRSGFNSAETIIDPTSAQNLKLHWSYKEGKTISTQPIEAHRLIYWGSWDGIEHATKPDGTQVWQQYLGKTVDSSCVPNTVGVASTATVASIIISGVSTPVLFVGGGKANFYALNASTGAILWHTSLGSSPGYFIWSSPVLFKGNIYIGLSSFGDCPLIQGQLLQLDAATGAIKHTFNVVPDGCIGGSIWGSPTIDPATDTAYVATGNAGSCSTREHYALAIIQLSTSTLSYISSWQISSPPKDSDFGSTPTLFNTTIGGAVHTMVGIPNKNGVYYAFDTTAISAGPVWTTKIAATGSCPQCGEGSIAPSAFDGKKLYVAGGNTTINGQSCRGSLRALDPATGGFIWQDCLQDGPVLGAISVIPAVAVVGEGNHLVVVATATGKTLFEHTVISKFYAAASISNGLIYIGSTNGTLYAFGT